MKTLYAVRHAKASWEDSDVPDKDRLLNDKGHFQADALSDYLSPLLPPPERILCSTAVRATETMNYFLEVWPVPEKNVTVSDALYMVDQDALLKEVQALDDEAQVAMIIGHNPGLTDLVQALASDRSEYVKRMKTCGFVQIDFTEDSWKDVTPGEGDVKLNLRPKDIRNL